MTPARLWMLIMAMPVLAWMALRYYPQYLNTPIVLALVTILAFGGGGLLGTRLRPVLKSARETGFCVAIAFWCVCFALASMFESLEGIGLTIPLTGPAAGLGGFMAARLVERPSS